MKKLYFPIGYKIVFPFKF